MNEHPRLLLNRRGFAGAMFASLALVGVAQPGSALAKTRYRSELAGYGPLITDPLGVLDLPHGFSYRMISHVGEYMSDGFIVPDKADGMACFDLGGSRVALVRNHELTWLDGAIGPTHGMAALEGKLRGRGYGHDVQGHCLPGGTTTIIYNTASGRTERQFLSLTGTVINCAGGSTPWGSWLSCEEVVISESDGVSNRSHGWVFEVPAKGEGLTVPTPLKGLGRFKHEAAAVDPRTGIVYLTEDQDDSLFYRFLPAQRGELVKGGRLQVLGLKAAPEGADSRNWEKPVLAAGEWHEVRWIDIDGTDNPHDDMRQRGHQAGAIRFARGEGVHFGDNELYFCCTSGGAKKIGQVMRYAPSRFEGDSREAGEPGRLQLFVESEDSELLNYADNLTIAPWGHLVVCEDRDSDPINYLRGITPEGKLYTIARHPGDTELAGVCFSPDGKTLFMNLYQPARTLAITGNWSAFNRAEAAL